MANRELKFSIKIFVGKDTVGYHALVPALKGLHTYGNTEREAVENAIKATVSYIKSLRADGEPIPLNVYRADDVCAVEHSFVFDKEYTRELSLR